MIKDNLFARLEADFDRLLGNEAQRPPQGNAGQSSAQRLEVTQSHHRPLQEPVDPPVK
ncbi:hypothetical protein LUCX_20 [Xanthomonas phage vB_XciM_LucasX]|nr:hypothetical protein LUCX_20 [Xanthomonas phage vB_XciM_LucasX]